MHRELTVTTKSGLVILRDAAVDPPANRAEQARARLRSSETDGTWFYLDADDAVEYRLRLTVDADPPDLPEHRFQRLGGSFLLRLPSGRLAISGLDEWRDGEVLEVESGLYSLTVRGPGEFDGAAYDEEIQALVGRDQWRHYHRIDRLGLAGCFSTLIAAAIIIVPMTRPYWPASLAALALGWLPHLLLTRTDRYRRVATSIARYEASLPHYVIRLQRIDQAGPLEGGHLHVG